MGLGVAQGRVMGLEGTWVGDNGPGVCMGWAERRASRLVLSESLRTLPTVQSTLVWAAAPDP